MSEPIECFYCDLPAKKMTARIQHPGEWIPVCLGHVTLWSGGLSLDTSAGKEKYREYEVQRLA